MKNWKISTRLSIAFATILLFSVVITIIGIWRMHKINDAKENMVTATYKTGLADEWLRGIATNSVRTFALVKLTDEADRKLMQDQMKATSERVSVVQKELESLVTSLDSTSGCNTLNSA